MHRNINFWQWLLLVFSTPGEGFRVAGAMLVGELARWLLGEETTFRYKCGDVIACILVYYAIRPFIARLPAVYGIPIPPDLIVISIALLGTHGVKSVVVVLAKKFGIDLTGASKNG